MKNWLFLLNLITLTTVFAQKPVVKLEIEPKQAQAGESITVTIKSNVQGEIDIDFPSAFIPGYSVMNGMQQETDFNTGKIITYYYYSQDGIIKKEGDYTFGPAFVKSGSKIYKSNTVNVSIKKEAVINSCGVISNKQLKLAAFGVVEKSRKQVYEGEPLVLNAKIYARFYPTHFEDYQSYLPDGTLEKQALGNNNKLIAEEEKIKGIDFYTIQYDRSIIFPNKSGKLQIDPFKLILKRGFEGMPIVSTGTVVDVLPLPANQPKSFIGMVGKLSMDYELSQSEVKKGDIVKLKVFLEGVGNLHNVITPKLELPKGITMYGDPSVDENYTFTANGAEGKISYEYTLQINHEGSFDIPDLKVAFFDPKLEKYVVLQKKLGTLNGPEIKDLSQKNGTTLLVEEQAKDDNEEQQIGTSLLKSPILWISVFSILALGAIVGFAFKPKSKKIETVFSKVENKQNDLIIQKKTNWLEVDIAVQNASQLIASGDSKQAIISLESALCKAAMVALELEHQNFTKDKLVELMRTHFCDKLNCDDFKNVINECQKARYGFGLTSDEEQELIASTKQIIAEIKRLT